nr:phospholipase-like protein [Tanacetum cinerariifolium]
MNESQYNTVQNSTLPALQDDLILSVIEQLKTQVVNCTKINQDNKQVNELLTAELKRYRNQERVLDKQKHDDKESTSYEPSLEIESLKHTLSKHLKEKESLEQKITILKNDFQKEESRNIDRELALEKHVKELNNIVFKRSQSAQTVLMLTKPQVFYNHSTRQTLGFQNPCYLKKAQQLKPKLYDGRIIEKSDVVVIPDTEETLMLAEECRSKMIEKQNDPQMTKKKVITKPIDYAILNQLSTDFETRFVPQIELSTEQAFWSQYSVQTDEPNLSATTTIVEVPKELPKVSMGFKHTKACFRDDIIPFVKALKELFTSFDQCLIDEVTEVQNVFKQMELAVEQHREDKNNFQNKMENVLNAMKHCSKSITLLRNIVYHWKFIINSKQKSTEAVSLNPIDPDLLKDDDFRGIMSDVNVKIDVVRRDNKKLNLTCYDTVGPIKEGFIVGFDLLKTFIDMGSRIKANEGSSLEVYDARVSVRSRLYLLKTIGSKLAFKPRRYKNFRSTVFGPWREFCSVTGFLFGNCSLDHLKGGNSCFLDLNKLLNNHTEFNKLLDDDDVRVCLLLALDFVFMGFELRHVIANELLGLVDDLLAWNDFPWGYVTKMDMEKKNNISEFVLCMITNMEVEFQRRITSIEIFLKIRRSPNLEKNSNVTAECMSVDKNTLNVDAECMSVDKNPSCRSDVKAKNKESMFVDSSVKTSCATDINANNVHSDSMDFDHDLKVVEQNEFDQNVANKNLIHDFDQTVGWKMNDESPIQPMVTETPAEGCKSGETSKSMISETQSHTCDSVKEANDAKVQREAKASKYRVSLYIIQPESTQKNHEVHARNKKVKKRGLPLTAHDGKVIPD